jgi:hypothetical protein
MYKVWRHKTLIHQFKSFEDLREWMLKIPAFSDYHEGIKDASERLFKNSSFGVWEEESRDLSWIAVMTDYCAISGDNRKPE